MRWPVVCCLTALTLTGCRSSCDKVEAELRAREADVHTLRSELEREQLSNQLLSRELAALQGVPGPDGVMRPPSEPYPVRTLALGRQTGGRYDDKLAGDDALQVQIEPRDTEGQAIKAPGAVVVEAYEVSAEGTKAPLSSWSISREDLRGKWENGLFNTGYVLTLPWKVPPITDKLRVVVRFQMLNGRTFEADKDVAIRVLPGALERRKALPLPAPAPVLPAPLPAEDKKPEEKKTLPPPKPEEGPALSRTSASGRVEVFKPVPMTHGARTPIVGE